MKKGNIGSRQKGGCVITFYSYKGGVGRSMALANLACLLVKRKKKVLLIDWDLEAPGLHHFFDEKSKGRKGLIDLMTEVRTKLDKHLIDNSEDGYVDFLEKCIDDFICKDRPVQFQSSGKQSFSLDIIKSGLFDEGYSERLNAFNWLGFYESYPSFFRILSQFLEGKYDYVLIDSRTGLADTSGICTMLLPDKLVLVFAPNDQNINGVLDVAKQALEYRLNSIDERSLELYPLPSRIDSQNPNQRKKWLDIYTSKFQSFFNDSFYLDHCDLKNYFEKATIRYVNDHAYGENLPVLMESATDKLSIASDYDNFLNILLSDDPIWEMMSEEEIADNELTESKLNYRVDLDFLEREINAKGKAVGIAKNQEVLLSIYDETVSRLAAKLIKECEKFDKYYLRNSFAVFIENNSIHGDKITSLAVNRNYLDERVSSIALNYNYDTFNRSNFQEFNYKSELMLKFHNRSYDVILPNVISISKSYGEQLSNDEIDRIIFHVTNAHKEFLEQKIKS